MEKTTIPPTFENRVKAVADIAAKHAADVDSESRFPYEAIDEAREQGLLGAPFSEEEGGLGASHAQLCEVGQVIAAACASTAMILMMHYSQALCLVGHASSEALLEFRGEAASEQLLLASATTEEGIGGDTRRSSCHIEEKDGRARVSKRCPVISYGRYADAILLTARRGVDSPDSDQVMMVIRQDEATLERTRGWDSMGMRGTMSEAFVVEAVVSTSMIFDDPFATISSHTMLPASHTLWASAWYGVASAAGQTARRSAQRAARKVAGTTPLQAIRVAELEVDLQRMHDSVTASIRRFDEARENTQVLESPRFAIAMDTLKISASRSARTICSQAMEIVGISAYSNASPMSLSRQVRDVHGFSLMIGNDRLLDTAAGLHMISRGER
ncbi:acyl-CoA dehydrogenase family protein [Curtobacterium sp. S6]|uniref:acyl-CoA dehydrogenase family protein n=1 Tax=Curtobacterium sp. S6 TaxID=1479623 RepID=UPI0004AB8E5E|nr:acyl-CoA dehydrogenase family protein [Curtobacterium sp. S6]